MGKNNKPSLTAKQNAVQVAKFVFFSCFAGIIQAVSFTILNETIEWKYWPSYLIALTLSVLYNFTVNRKFTFKSAANVPIAMLKVFGYYCVFTPVSTVLGNYCKETLGINEYIVLAVTMISNLVTEFLFCRFVVYRNSINTQNTEDKKPQR
ncbi:MAG: GtrA-like protein [Firmicutes bacterium ADurb.Bin300]|nr:MAG: GtrA-like protein [Firmicutes bacterium ADurb.Bin300]